MVSTLARLELKYGDPVELIKEEPLWMSDDCGEGYTKCTYAIGDPDCQRCKGAMFG